MKSLDISSVLVVFTRHGGSLTWSVAAALRGLALQTQIFMAPDT